MITPTERARYVGIELHELLRRMVYIRAEVASLRGADTPVIDSILVQIHTLESHFPKPTFSGGVSDDALFGIAR